VVGRPGRRDDLLVGAEDGVHEVERLFRLLAEHSSDVVALLRPDGHVKWLSRPFGDTEEYRPTMVMGHLPWHLLHPDDRARGKAALAEVVATGRLAEPLELRFRVGENEYHWVSATGRRLADGDGIVMSFRDVTDAVLARRALAESERQFRLAMQGSPTGMAVVGLDGGFVSVNPALCTQLGHPSGWWVGRRLDEVLHPNDAAADREVRACLLDRRCTEQMSERRLVTATAEIRDVLHSVGLLRDEEGAPLFFVCQFLDITARKAAEARLHHAATHDHLTGVANRTLLTDEIHRALAAEARSGRPASLVMIDLDHFKAVNDRHGHAAGDALLCEVARRIRTVVREGDFLARLGGDEFVVVMRDLDDVEEASRVAARLVDAIRVPMVVGDVELHPSASIGVAVSRHGEGGPDALLREADAALYVAKAQGRGRCALHAA
jgi:diguanylate cyclase (GGDEF)-like protein/PAS domain S-box-containing protein